MKNSFSLALFLFAMISLISCSNMFLKNQLKSECHPQCSWKCDDPKCPAICDPICEPPKCHTSCAEPKNAICDVKCEKPDCEIKCPDKGSELFGAPGCVTVCKQPHCVTHCQAPKPECEAVCEEPKCDWKCHKPACPKPKCELVCENPTCGPKVDCCQCDNNSAEQLSLDMPFFKESESNPKCCGCNNKNASISSKSSIEDYENRLVHKETSTTTIPLKEPKAIGDSFYEYPQDKVDEFNQNPTQATK